MTSFASLPPSSAKDEIDVLNTNPEHILIPSGDYRYYNLIVGNGSDLVILDSRTFLQATTQPDSFGSTILGLGFDSENNEVFVGLSNGNIGHIDLDDTETFFDTEEDTTSSGTSDNNEPQDSREIYASEFMSSQSINGFAYDDDNNTAYMSNSSGNFYIYNVSQRQLTEIPLEVSSSNNFDEEQSSNVQPIGMAFSDNGINKKIIVITSDSEVLNITTSGNFSTQTLIVDENFYQEPEFNDIWITPTNEYALILDTANSAIWVYDIADNIFIDMQQNESTLDPLEISTDFNTNFTYLSFWEDDDNNDLYGILQGELGTNYLDFSNLATKPSDSLIRDPYDIEENTNPQTLAIGNSGLSVSDTDLNYIYTFNSLGNLQVLTDSPWIFNLTSSLERLTEDEPIFNLSFECDTDGTYEVYINSDARGESGHKIISQTNLEDADSTTTTADIDISDLDRDTLPEGSNVFLVKVSSTSLSGHRALNITVDRPPEAITVNSLNFGNKKIYFNFEVSPDNDIQYYTVFVTPALNQNQPECESADFSSSETISANLEPDQCTLTNCSSNITNLTNNIFYCVGVSATDNSDQTGPLGTFSEPMMPEATLGPAFLLGEQSCSFSSSPVSNVSFLFFTVTSFFIFAYRFLKSRKNHFMLFLVIFISIFSLNAKAQIVENKEATPQHFTLEPKLSFWIPTNGTVKDFYGNCCQMSGEIEFGYLLTQQQNVTLTSGFGYTSAQAKGVTTGRVSGDEFSFITVPVRLDYIYRFDYKVDQLIVPYARLGLDLVYFKESGEGSSLQNYKYGWHTGLGLAILLDKIDGPGHDFEVEKGVNDVYLTLELRYAQINSFTNKLDLSGYFPTIGVLFEF